MKGPVFLPRINSEKYQVRFWSTLTLYAEFKIICEKENLVIQDVFNQFMEWFIESKK